MSSGALTFVSTNLKDMYNKPELLENLNRQTEIHLQLVLREWQLRSDEALTASPVPGGWSAAQCLEHLNFYGDYYLPEMERAIRNGQQEGRAPATTFKPGWLGRYFTRQMLPNQDGTLASKMKAPKGAVPSVNPDPRAVLEKFIDHQEQMLLLIGLAESVPIGALRIPISIAPWIRLKLGDVFLFMCAHNYRHLLQAERALGQGSSTLQFCFDIQ